MIQFFERLRARGYLPPTGQNWAQRQTELNKTLAQAKLARNTDNEKPTLDELNFQLMALGIRDPHPQIVVDVKLPGTLPDDISPTEEDAANKLRFQAAIDGLVNPTLGDMHFTLRADTPFLSATGMQETIVAGLFDSALGVAAGMALSPDFGNNKVYGTDYVIPLRFVEELTIDRRGGERVSRATPVSEAFKDKEGREEKLDELARQVIRPRRT